jgi:hypothetical protein
MSGVIDLDSLPQPGTQPFFPALLSCIRSAAPSLPLDPVVLQALLLCLLADDKNLILRTREEDIGCVSKLVASVSVQIFSCCPFIIIFFTPLSSYQSVLASGIVQMAGLRVSIRSLT